MVIISEQRKVRRRGMAAVEAALILPVILLVTFGAIKYGWLFLRAQQITNAARYGARMAILPDAELLQVEGTIINLLGQANIDVNESDIAITPADFTDLGGGVPVKVQITIPSRKVDIMKISLLPAWGDIRASVTMAKEGP